MSETPSGCPLCGEARAEPFFHDRFRRYLHCPGCDLVYVPPEERLGPEAEKARYDLHENHPGNLGYRRFLQRLCEPMCERIPRGAEGLDFGCGPGGALATLFLERGRRMIGYDPFYAPEASVWSREWDFITASEVLEHLHHPAGELDRLFRVLKPGGWLGILTGWRPDPVAFATWHYITDSTHVAFYSPATFRHIAARWQVDLTLIDPHIALMRKPPVLDPAGSQPNPCGAMPDDPLLHSKAGGKGSS